MRLPLHQVPSLSETSYNFGRRLPCSVISPPGLACAAPKDPYIIAKLPVRTRKRQHKLTLPLSACCRPQKPPFTRNAAPLARVRFLRPQPPCAASVRKPCCCPLGVPASYLFHPVPLVLIAADSASPRPAYLPSTSRWRDGRHVTMPLRVRLSS